MIITATNPAPNTVTLSANYLHIESSTAVGALFVLLLVDDTGNISFSKSVYLALDRMESVQFMQSNISQGNYTVLAFRLEQNGRFMLGQVLPATIESVIVSGQG